MIELITGIAAGAIVRIIQAVVIDFFLNVLCYYSGRLFMLAVSLGRYDKVFNVGKTGMFESIVGLVILVSAVIYITN